MSATNQVIRERVEKNNKLLEYAEASRQNGVNIDVCIKTENKSFQAHRLILSCYSEYFRTMFQTEMKEKYADSVEIESVDETSLELLINFIYSGKICITQNNVFNLLAASDYLQIDEAKQFCIEFMYSSISVETCFQVLKVADAYQYSNLLNKTFQFIRNNLAEIVTKNDLKVLPKQTFLNFLSQLRSEFIEEHLVYDAIIGWTKHREIRQDDFVEVFQHLDLAKLSSSFLMATVSIEPLVVKNHFCFHLVLKSLATTLQAPVSRVQSKILSLGGRETPKKVFVLYKKDRKVYPELLQDFIGHSSLKLGKFVYCLGGWEKRSSSNKVWRMKISETNMEWEKVASMKLSRTDFGAVAYKNGIVVVGGCSSTSKDVKKSVEFFDPSLNQWSVLPSIKEDRGYHALATCNNRLFCFGGFSNNCLSSVEMLCDENKSWQYVQSMQTPRDEFAAVNCTGNIYAIGGHNFQYKSMKSVEKYDSQLNKWTYVKSMNKERRGHSACVMQDKIFVVGGFNEARGYVSEIECYNPFSDDWTIVGKTDQKLVRHSIVAV